jgi:hypothetical protein
MYMGDVNLKNEILPLVMQSDRIVILLLVARKDGNVNYLESELENFFTTFKHKDSINYYILAFNEDELPFPYPITDILYWFLPNNPTPIFYKQGLEAVSKFNDDYLAASTMLVDGVSYIEATRTKEDIETIERVDAELTTDIESLPPTYQMVRTLGKEMFNTAKRFGRSLPVLVPSGTVTERYSICEKCPHLTDNARCTKCGCFMKAKVNLATSSCPIGKWGEYTPHAESN